MGILNVTPDSFSDGGKYLDASVAVDHGLRMAAEGAAILDLGAESTRPGSRGVSAREQLARLLPVVKGLRAKSSIALSIDTRSADVAAACLDEGASIVNDVSALRHDPRMAETLAPRTCSVILMHMLGTPETMQQDPVYADVIGEIGAFFAERLEACERTGIARERAWLDPGVGFGKTFAHNLEIVRRCAEFAALGRPLVLGVSRKSFLGTLSGESDPARRDAASIAAGLLLARNGAQILRVHDVAGHVAALKVAAGL
jgi:dihydropteroate synthase